MGTIQRERVREPIADALFTPVQQRLLALMFVHPDRWFGTAEIIRAVGSGTGAVHRQLQRLGAAGVLTIRTEGNQKLYQANRASPVFAELRGLVLKTTGLRKPILDALQPLASGITAAFIYGSVAKGNERASSDVDLLVIGQGLDYSLLYDSLHKAEAAVSRSINPTLLTPDEWRTQRSQNDGFVKRISEQPKLFVIGDENVLT